MSNTKIYTAESVTGGHPDKICDAVSDAVLDAALTQDPESRVACEAFATKGLIVIGGEISTKAKLNYPEIVRETAKRLGLDFTGAELYVAVHEQSPDISDAVNGITEEGEQGAGDQGIMVGYATDETEEYLPLEYALARRLTDRLESAYLTQAIPGIKGDGKSQVSVRFTDGKFAGVTKIVVSVQHAEDKPLGMLKNEIIDRVIIPVFSGYDINGAEILINPSGRFVVGGIDADTGLTGRKIVADAYGPRVPVGGGAFSGKDASKVDRSGAYYARYVAKNVVAAGLAKKCLVQIAYAIGKAEPLAVNIDTFGTNTVPEEKISAATECVFNFKPASIIAKLDLKKPIYSATSSGGHFGRDAVCGRDSFPWESLDKAYGLRRAAVKQ
jgi:S-adenosylmethionine synthetase